MDSTVRVNASVISSRVGNNAAVNDNYYFDGRFMTDIQADCVQASFEKDSREFLFSISRNMDRDMPDRETSISFVKELSRFHKKIKSSIKDIKDKFDDLCGLAEEVNNLVYSLGVGSEQPVEKAEPSLAGLLITGNKAAVLTIGDVQAYVLRDGMVKQLTAEHRKAERLLRMGIITSEQAEVLSKRFGVSQDRQKASVRKSDIMVLKEGDIFLLASDNALEEINEDSLYEILSTKQDTDYIVNKLMDEALKKGAVGNITFIVARIDGVGEEERSGYSARIRPAGYSVKGLGEMPKIGKVRLQNVRRFVISTLLVFIVVFGIFYFVDMLFSKNKSGETEDVIEHHGAFEDEIYGEPAETSSEDEDVIDGEDIDGEPDYAGGTDETGGNEGPVIYTVKSGDNLRNISSYFYNDPEKYILIMEANGIENPDIIYVGQELIIPDIEEQQ